MKSVILPAVVLATALTCGPVNAEFSQIQNVYLLPMGNGFDQYLANHLTNEGVFQVVTDPQQADALFTDQIGLAFEKRFEELYPPPEPPKKESEESEEEKADAKDTIGSEPPVRFSSFGRGKGNLFLVDRRSRRVVWSIHERPKDFTPKQLDRSAGRVIDRLKKSAAGKQ